MNYPTLVINPSRSFGYFSCKCEECVKRRVILQSIPRDASFFIVWKPFDLGEPI